MRILAIDAATPVAGVALSVDHRLVAERFLDHKKNHSQFLLPMIAALLQETETSLSDLDALAVTIGPGSFTGLRIGLATAKGLSLAAGLPVIPVSTLATLAHNFAAGSHLVVPVLNARKHEVYAGFFRVQSSFPEAVAPEQALSPAEAAAAIKQLQRTLHLSAVCMPGDGFEPYRELWTEALGGNLISIPTALSRPRAGALASLAAAKAERGEFGDIFDLRPNYLRLSEAEYHLRKEH